MTYLKQCTAKVNGYDWYDFRGGWHEVCYKKHEHRHSQEISYDQCDAFSGLRWQVKCCDRQN